MKAWRLHSTGRLELDDTEVPGARTGGVVVRMQAAPVLSYMRKVIDGSLRQELVNEGFFERFNKKAR